MNIKQVIIILGLAAYIAGGVTAVAIDLGTFVKIIRFRPHLLTPIFVTFSIILIVGIALIRFFKDKKK